jgi:hypothetical protein
MEPTLKQMEKWHKEYGCLFTVKVKDKEFICKGISRKQYKRIRDDYEDDEYRQEEEICRASILYPVIINYDNEYAGLPNSLASQILIESGFGDSPKVGILMEKYRAEMDDFMNQVSCMIQEAFPLLSLEEIEDWPLEKTLWYLSRAEWKLKYFRGMGPREEDEGEIQGNEEDFPELAAEKAFMSGKMT